MGWRASYSAWSTVASAVYGLPWSLRSSTGTGARPAPKAGHRRGREQALGDPARRIAAPALERQELAIVAVQHEADPDHLAVGGDDLEAIGAPSLIRAGFVFNTNGRLNH